MATVHVRLSRHLTSLLGGPAELGAELDAEGATVAELVAELERRRPGLRAYLLDDQGALREHVNVFVDGEPLADRARLRDVLRDGQRVHVLQAVSGG